jgi:endonuclease/exonuclease/phosphatase family metal-dependent hydrolase
MRIATFNTENLFSRARVLNFKNNADGDTVLVQIAALQAELEKQVYNKTLILTLYNNLKDFIEIQENRGKLFKRKLFAITGVLANGVADWDGTIEFKREKFSETTRINTAKVLKAVQADVQCLVEVESRNVLHNFNADMLGTKKFAYNILIDGNDERGIDVGLLSRYPIKNIRTHIFDKEKPNSRSCLFSRDCLEVELEVKPGQPLYILCNHFKSKGYSGSQAAANKRRALQAAAVKDIVSSRYNLQTDWVVILGDFNDTPDAQPLTALLQLPHLYDVLQLQFADDMQQRYTYYYNNKVQIDYILVSKPLQQNFKQAGVERRGMYELNNLSGGTEIRFDTVTAVSNAASDHAAVWADFNI